MPCPSSDYDFVIIPLNHSHSQCELNKFASDFKRVAKEVGMSIINSLIVVSYGGTMEDIKTTYMNELNDSDFVFAVLLHQSFEEIHHSFHT